MLLPGTSAKTVASFKMLEPMRCAFEESGRAFPEGVRPVALKSSSGPERTDAGLGAGGRLADRSLHRLDPQPPLVL